MAETPTSALYKVVNPATGDVEELFPTASDPDILAALDATNEAFAVWKDVPMSERSNVLSRVGALFGERAANLAKIINQEMGKPIAAAMDEIDLVREIFDYYSTEGPALAADRPIKQISGGQAMIQHLPLGPLLGIMPWNYPYYQVARFAAPNLMLGNTIIIKHAPNCPRSALAIHQIFADAGLPQGAYVNVFATNAQVAAIIADPRVQGVSLTGGEKAGAAVAEIAGRNLKKVVLELGGSDAYIILDSRDVRASAAAALSSRLSNSGQACNSPKRIIVMDDIYDEFVEEVTHGVRSLTPSNGSSDGYAPMASSEAADNLIGQIDDAVSKGAVLRAGGVRVSRQGFFIAPAVMTGVTKDMRAYREEMFGPVVVIYKVSSEDEAIQLANDSDYGLGASVFSEDVGRARQVGDKLEVGMVSVNHAPGSAAALPFGGIKRSGIGRELGPLGMDEFVNKRLVFISG